MELSFSISFKCPTITSNHQWDRRSWVSHENLKTDSSNIKLIFTPSICFPGGSVGKESTCNVGDPSSIPGLRRSPGEGIGCPLQYSWASLMAQLVKKPPAMQKTWVRSLGWEDPLEKVKATHSSILAWRIPWGHKELDKTEQLLLHIINHILVFINSVILMASLWD